MPPRRRQRDFRSEGLQNWSKLLLEPLLPGWWEGMCGLPLRHECRTAVRLHVPQAAPLYSADPAALVLGNLQVAEDWASFLRAQMHFSLRLFAGHLNWCSVVLGMVKNFTICLVCHGDTAHPIGQQTAVMPPTGSPVIMKVDETLNCLLSELYEASAWRTTSRDRVNGLSVCHRTARRRRSRKLGLVGSKT